MQIASIAPAAGGYRTDQASAVRESAPAGGVVGSEKKGSGGKELSSEEQREVQRLETRDREVRKHERAHQAAGGQYVRGGPSFETERGPDGKTYAVGGEVQIDTSPIAGNPSATIQKMQQVRRAALAPADPSSADRQVAADASEKERVARKELQEEMRAGEAGREGGKGGREISPTRAATARYEESSAYGAPSSRSSSLNLIV